MYGKAYTQQSGDMFVPFDRKREIDDDDGDDGVCLANLCTVAYVLELHTVVCSL